MTDKVRLGRLILLGALVLVIVGAKFRLIDQFGSDLPYWDQWDGEGDFLIRPFLEGRLTAQSLVAPHNEHRILFTRLIALGLFEINDRQWDARLEMAVNAFLHATVAVLIAAIALRTLPRVFSVGLTALTALFFSSCTSWENTLGGFQSQFYLMTLFAALHIGGTFLARPRSWPWRLAPLAGAAALFTMASGVLSACAALGVTILVVLRDRKFSGDQIYVAAANLVLLAAGWLLRVPPMETDLVAKGLWPGIESWWHVLAWPVGEAWVAPLNILPLLVIGLFWFRRRASEPAVPLLLASGAWYWLQAAAIAYARGAFEIGTQYISRYTDLTSIGVLINLFALTYLAVHFLAARARAGVLAATVLSAAASIWGLSAQATKTWNSQLIPLPAINAARIDSVRHYVVNHDQTFFQKQPWAELPYPSADRLASLLDVPVLGAILPPSVRPAVPLEADPAGTQGFGAFPQQAMVVPPPFGLQAWDSGTGSPRPARFLSQPFVVDHSRLSLFVVGSAGPENVKIQISDGRGDVHEPLDSAFLPSTRWKRVNFVLPKGTDRLEITLEEGWMAFSLPFTTTPLSSLAEKATRHDSWFLCCGAVSALVALILLAGPVGRGNWLNCDATIDPIE